MAATTIQVQEDTLTFLQQLRERYEAPSYDAVLKILFQKAMTPTQSLWGRGGKLALSKILKGLRDESDRY